MTWTGWSLSEDGKMLTIYFFDGKSRGEEGVMRKIEKVMLLDTRELIVSEGVEFEEYDHYERQPVFDISGYELVRAGQALGLKIHHYPGPFIRWNPTEIEGKVEDGILDLVLNWGDGRLERISYNGKFMVWWAE